jgi:predicted esterase
MGRVRKRAKQLVAALALPLLAWCAAQPFLVVREAALRVITLPDDTPSSWLTALMPERTGVLLAARFLDLIDDGEELDILLASAYERMDRALGRVPTPAITTYLGMQSSTRFDTVVIEPATKPTAALVFLHGYAGNFNIYCWHMAEAVRSESLLVVCPSLGPRGDFWSEQGLDTVRSTLDYVRARGLPRVFLAGLSNGAVGAGVMAPKLASQLAGVILISGAPTKGSATNLPTLVVQGKGDEMMPARLVRAHARRAPYAEYVELPGGHFVFLSRHDEVGRALREWLSRQASP